jgi:hypothetical protein
MLDNKLDKIFTEEKDQASLAPPAFVWDNLEHDLKLKNKRRPVFIYWLKGIFIFLGIAGLIYFLNGENSESVTFNSNINTQIEPNLKEESTSTINDIQSPNSIVNNQYSIDNQLNPNESSSNYTDKTNIENKSPSTSNTQKKATSINPTITKSTLNAQENLLENSKHNTFTSFEDQLNSTHFLNDKEDIISQNNFEPESELKAQRSSRITSFLNTEIRTKVNSNTLPYFLPSEAFSNLSHNSKFPETKIEKTQNILTVYFHIGKPIFSDDPLSDDKINKPETDWYSLGGGINYERNISSKFVAGIGFNYTLSKRKFNYNSSELYLLNTASSSFEYGSLESQGEQKFTLIDLPLSLKYQFSKNKMRFSVGLSAILNLQLSTSGKTLESDGSITKYSNVDNRYQSSIGLGYSPFLSLDFPIQKQIYLSISPRYTGYLTDLEDRMKERFLGYSSFGFDVGLSRQF